MVPRSGQTRLCVLMEMTAIKMMTKTNPTGDLGDRSNPTNQATPEGRGSKVTVDPQGNPVSIMVTDHGSNRVRITGHKAFAAGEAIPSSVQQAQVPGVYPVGKIFHQAHVTNTECLCSLS
jgi:hypothetical protein